MTYLQNILVLIKLENLLIRNTIIKALNKMLRLILKAKTFI